MTRLLTYLTAGLAALAAALCLSPALVLAAEESPYPPAPVWQKKIALTSTAFEALGKIPARHSDDGANISPALQWKNVPSGTKELVIMLEDPDGTAGNFSHWLLYGLQPNVSKLPEAVPAKPTLDQPPAKQGKNSLLQTGYAGPAPVPGSGVHHYTFRIFAQSCAFCHGRTGMGDGEERGNLSVPPERLAQIRATPEYINQRLRRGVPGSAMPYFTIYEEKRRRRWCNKCAPLRGRENDRHALEIQ